MPVTFRFLPEHFLIYFRIEGWIEIQEAVRAATELRAAPAYRKGMRQLVDLSALTGWERNFTAIMKEHANQVDVLDDPQRPSLIVLLAPHEEASSLAQAIRTPWERSQRAVMVTVDSEVEALTVLGIDAPSVAAVIEGV
ncbi:MAG: hypothetical protein KDK08_10275 [Rhizobiaceae bacterium]|nr:hypothetical protein [Rhizobiaceae bacterium]